MIHKIEKEEISTLSIIPATNDQTDKWKKELEYAVRLGNEHKGKTIITFNTTQGVYQVETTVWAVTEKRISLKAGIMIPLNAIIKIEF